MDVESQNFLLARLLVLRGAEPGCLTLKQMMANQPTPNITATKNADSVDIDCQGNNCSAKGHCRLCISGLIFFGLNLDRVKPKIPEPSSATITP